MKKKEFMQELEEHLLGISKADKEEILQDYEEHFAIGKKNKKTESQIAKSLGDPKEIARTARRELTAESTIELVSEAVEAWVSIKRFCIDAFTQTEQAVRKAFLREDSSKLSFIVAAALFAIAVIILLGHPVLLVLLLALAGLYLYQQKKKRKSKNVHAAMVVVLVLLNVLFVVWVWLGAFFTLLGVFLSSLAMLLAGIFLALYAVISLALFSTALIQPVLLASVLTGVGVAILGGLLLWLMRIIVKMFLSLTKSYVNWNLEVIRQ